MSKIRVIRGGVSHSWTWIFGAFMVGGRRVRTGNIVRMFTLKASNWAKVKIHGNVVVEIVECR